MERWVDKVALVTGANSDLGRNIVEELLQKGMKVVGLDRRIDKIKILADEIKSKSGKLFPVQVDMTNRDEIIRAMEWLEKNLGRVDVLINNASIDAHTGFFEGTMDDWDKIFETNILGLTLLTRESLKMMKKRGSETSYIINMNDTKGLRVLNRVTDIMTSVTTRRMTSSAYDATKVTLGAITDSLRMEIAKSQSNIKVTSLYLGMIDTEETMSMMKEKPRMILKTKDVVDTLIFALMTPEHVLIQDMVMTPIREIL